MEFCNYKNWWFGLKIRVLIVFGDLFCILLFVVVLWFVVVICCCFFEWVYWFGMVLYNLFWGIVICVVFIVVLLKEFWYFVFCVLIVYVFYFWSFFWVWKVLFDCFYVCWEWFVLVVVVEIWVDFICECCMKGNNLKYDWRGIV